MGSEMCIRDRPPSPLPSLAVRCRPALLPVSLVRFPRARAFRLGTACPRAPALGARSRLLALAILPSGLPPDLPVPPLAYMADGLGYVAVGPKDEFLPGEPAAPGTAPAAAEPPPSAEAVPSSTPMEASPPEAAAAAAPPPSVVPVSEISWLSCTVAPAPSG